MDSERFDHLAKTVGGAVSRRGALAVLVSAGLTGIAGAAEARKKRRKGQGKGKTKRKAIAKPAGRVSTEAADCLSPGPSSNMSGCDFDGSDFSGDDLSSSRMVGTTFRNATLIETNLSSSTMKNAVFRGADLCGADLSSSQLKNADFRGFAAPGQATNLFRADLSSSGCRGMKFNARTLFCRTKTCNGSFRDDDCPAGIDPQDVCCLDAGCPAGRSCVDNQCEACDAVNCPDGCCTPEGKCHVDSAFACGGTGGAACGPACADNEACVGGDCVSCATACPDEDCARCSRLVDGSTICGGDSSICTNAICTSSAPCVIGRCILSYTSKATGAVTEFGPVCGFPAGAAVCGGVENC